MTTATRMPRAGVLPVLALAGLVMLAGCSGGDGTPGAAGSASTATSPVGSSTTTATSPGGSSTATDGALASGAAGAPTAGQSLAPLPVLASRTTSASRRRITIELNEVRSEGQVMTVTFTARNGGQDSWQVTDFFADGVSDNPGSAFSTVDAFSADGVYVIEPQAAKRYLVARDANKVCVCSGNLSGTFVKAGQAVVLSAVFRAPPPEVATVDVSIPKAGIFSKVQVTR